MFTVAVVFETCLLRSNISGKLNLSDKLWSADAVVPPSGWNNQTRDRGLSELWFCGICIWEGAGSSFACCLLLQGYAIVLV